MGFPVPSLEPAKYPFITSYHSTQTLHQDDTNITKWSSTGLTLIIFLFIGYRDLNAYARAFTDGGAQRKPSAKHGYTLTHGEQAQGRSTRIEMVGIESAAIVFGNKNDGGVPPDH